tara:strand:- start:53167 stop:53394 length:228 start_codon:yes stop_codon:yes gene_type:complete
MQLTTFVTTIDFFPEAFIAEESGTVIKRFMKRVTFNKSGLKSYSVVTASTAHKEWSDRISNGAKVTGYNVEKMPS